MGSIPPNYVIVGAGRAGASAAEALRAEGFGGQILMLGAEDESPYDRPPLTKEYLRGEAEASPHLHDRHHYAGEWVDLRTSARVTRIDTAASEVELADGDRIPYEKLLLATGAEPRRLPVKGADLQGVHTLRTIADADAIRAAIRERARVVVIGAGWIGCEVAASARQMGGEVTIVESAAVPLERVLGPDIGGFYRDLHRDHGVSFVGEAAVTRIEGDGRAEAVVLADGRRLDADLVVVGIGVVPRTELAEQAEIEVRDGILVGPDLQTSAPGVFAAGDVASVRHPFYRRHVRVEHWDNAGAQGQAAARSMLGQEVSFDEIPYFFSDQYDVGMEYAGLANASDDLVLRGDLAAREFIAFWLRDGRLTAGMNVNVWDVSEPIRQLIRAPGTLDPEALADPEVPIEDLAATLAAGAGR